MFSGVVDFEDSRVVVAFKRFGACEYCSAWEGVILVFVQFDFVSDSHVNLGNV